MSDNELLENELKELFDCVFKQDWRAVIREVDVLIDECGENALLLFFKGDAFFKLENYDAALEFLEKSLKMDSNNGLAWFEKGVIMGKLGLMDSCLSCLDLASGLLEDPIVALYAKGDILLKKERYSEALNTFNQLLAINPTHEDSYYKKGDCLYGLERYEEAISAFNMVLEIDDTNNFDFSALAGKSECLIMLGRLEDALELNDTILKIKSNFAGPWIQRARIFAMAFQMEDAIKCINKALEYEPNNIGALKIRNMILDIL